MQCELTFYVAHKTGNNEHIFDKKLSGTELKITKTMVATSPVDLGEQLQSGLRRSNLIFIIGGLKREDETNIVEILSKSLESNSKQKIICKRIENSKGENDGYIVQSGRQMIVMLPDDPKELDMMVGYVLLKYISDFYNLKLKMKKDKRESVKFKTVVDAAEFYEKIYNNTAYELEEPPKMPILSRLVGPGAKAIRLVLLMLGLVAISIIVVYIVFTFVIYR